MTYIDDCKHVAKCELHEQEEEGAIDVLDALLIIILIEVHNTKQ